MEQRTKHLLMYASVAIVFLAAGLVAGKLMWGGTSYVQSPASTLGTSTGENANIQDTEANDGTSAAAPTPPPADPLVSCEGAIKAEAASKGLAYEKGDILISFDAGVTYEGAVEILDAAGLAPHNSPSPQQQFEANHWLTADVKSGDEARQACILKNISGVKYAGLNYTFKLAE